MPKIQNINNIDDIKDLARHAAKGTTPTTEYSSVDVDESLREEMNSLCKTYREFQRNKNDIFEIIEETADEIVPKKVEFLMGPFAEIKQTANGVKTVFKQRVGKNRAKKFLTQVGLSGVYETFRLDSSTFELKAHAIGGGAYLDFERFLSGDENMSEYMDIILEGLEEAVTGEVLKALKASYTNTSRPAANKKESNTFEADKMVALCNTVKAYGNGATIFATADFIAGMGIDNFGTTALPGYSAIEIEEMRTKGKVGLFRGNPIVEIPNSYTDETNTTTKVDSAYAYVLPTGGEKVVKILFEGNTEIHDFENRDNSMEMHAYKKFGVAILTHYNWGIYKNASLVVAG